MTEFNESDHPRDNNGKFSSSGGGSNSGPDIKKKLTSTEKTYIEYYTGDGFYELNKKLREGAEPDGMTKMLDSAISKGTIPEGTKLYRGMPREVARTLFKDGNVKAGDSIEDKAFMSTSKDIRSAYSNMGGVIFEITVGEGQNGIDVEQLSHNKEEKEVILPRNQKLTVKSITPPKKIGDPVIIKVNT